MFVNFWPSSGPYVVFVIGISLSTLVVISLCLWFHQKKREKVPSTTKGKVMTVEAVSYSTSGKTVTVDDAIKVKEPDQCGVLLDDGTNDRVANIVISIPTLLNVQDKSPVASSPRLPPRTHTPIPTSLSTGISNQQTSAVRQHELTTDTTLHHPDDENDYDTIDIRAIEGKGLSKERALSSSCESLNMPKFSPMQSLLSLITSELEPSHFLSRSSVMLPVSAMYGGYSTLDGAIDDRRTNSLTDVRSLLVESPVISTAIDSSNAKDRMPVYAVVTKPVMMKRSSSDEKIRPIFYEKSQLYSKVDKSRKRMGDKKLPESSGGAPPQRSLSLFAPKVSSLPTTTTVPGEVDPGVSDGAYEPINLSEPPKGEGDYDTVAGEDYGYDSVDIVVQKARKGRLPSLATLKRTSEHVYDIVPELLSDLTDLRPLSSHDYDHIAEVVTEKV